MYLPLESVHNSDSLSYVFTEEKGLLVRKEVSLGLLNDNQVIIESGLTTDDWVYLSLPDDTEDLPVITLNGEMNNAIAEERD